MFFHICRLQENLSSTCIERGDIRSEGLTRLPTNDFERDASKSEYEQHKAKASDDLLI